MTISDSLALRLVNQVPVLSPGATGTLLAEAYDPAAPELGLPAEVTWHTDDASIIAIDGEGRVTGGEVAGTVAVGAQIGEDETTRVVTEIRNIAPADDATLTVVTCLLYTSDAADE